MERFNRRRGYQRRIRTRRRKRRTKRKNMKKNKKTKKKEKEEKNNRKKKRGRIRKQLEKTGFRFKMRILKHISGCPICRQAPSYTYKPTKKSCAIIKMSFFVISPRPAPSTTRAWRTLCGNAVSAS